MKILHLVSGRLNSGAARGAVNLHRALLQAGVISTVLSNDPEADEAGVLSISNGAIGRMGDRFRRKTDRLPLLAYPRRLRRLFSCGLVGFDFRDTEAFNSADVIHLHWVAGGLLNVRHLARIKKPVVWSLRDMWPFTGGCHYSLDCRGFETACGKCPQLRSGVDKDLSRYLSNRKRRFMPERLTAVGISSWLTAAAMRSSAMAGVDVRTIPNGIEIADYYPESRQLARQTLGLPAGKIVVAAGAQHMTDFYKGSHQLVAALNLLDPEIYHVVLFGNGCREIADVIRPGSTSLGFVTSPGDLRTIYSAADVFVAPSTMEAFGKMLVEAMACETPVVCFDATGPGDIVDHKINGFKATPFLPESFAEGIEWVAMARKKCDLGTAARAKANAEFNSALMAQRYLALYEDLIAGAPARDSGVG